MKITFVTGQNWDAKRQGGFHVFAQKCAQKKIETVFFSFPRPYYGVFLKRENLNKKILQTLKKGKSYFLEGGEKILNVAFPTFRIPDAIGKFFSAKFVIFLATTSILPFKFFAKKFLFDTDCFVFESCEGVYLLKKIKKLFPRAKIIYRPSDPLVYDLVPARLKKAEREMLFCADKVLLVAKESVEAYAKSISDFEKKVKYKIVHNGVDLSLYKKKYDAPALLKKPNTVLYVGAWPCDWELLFFAAKKIPAANFIVVCPNVPEKNILKKVSEEKNLFFVDGIKPSEVPAWITNCAVVMVPYPADFYKDRYLSITAKYFQAMAAKKPIVSYGDTPKLKEVGIALAFSYEEFVRETQNALLKKEASYDFDLENRDWNKIGAEFLRECGWEG